PTARPHAALPPARARPPAAAPPRVPDRVPLPRRAPDPVAERHARPARGGDRARAPVPALPALARAALPARRRTRGHRGRGRGALPLLLRPHPLPLRDRRRLRVGPLPGLQLRPDDPAQPSAARARPEQLLDLLRAGYGEDELGAALLLRLAARRDRPDRDDVVRPLPPLGVRAPGPRPPARPRAQRGAQPARRPRTPARVGLHRRARGNPRRERLLPHDAVLLLLRVPGARARAAG